MIIPTFILMTTFKAKYPEYDFYFACGSDLFLSMQKWKYGLELLGSQSFIIFYRKGEKELTGDLLPKSYLMMESEEISEMSSTIVRNTLKWSSIVE